MNIRPSPGGRVGIRGRTEGVALTETRIGVVVGGPLRGRGIRTLGRSQTKHSQNKRVRQNG